MLIYHPLSFLYISQKFGENRACVNTAGKVITKRGNLCPAGYDDLYKRYNMLGHGGIDIPSYYKQKCYFPVVAETTWRATTEADSSGGIGIDVIGNSPVWLDHLPPQAGRDAKKQFDKIGEDGRKGYMFVKFRFWHGQRNTKEYGEEVKLGDVIQLCDSTGASSGNHLHWSMKFVDENGNTLDKDNGYYGAVDFSDWYDDRFVMDFLGRKPTLTIAEHFFKVAHILKRFPVAKTLEEHGRKHEENNK